MAKPFLSIISNKNTLNTNPHTLKAFGEILIFVT